MTIRTWINRLNENEPPQFIKQISEWPTLSLKTHARMQMITAAQGPGVVKLLQAPIVNDTSTSVTLVMTLALGGDLVTVSNLAPYGLSSCDCKAITEGLLSALSRLHGVGIGHGDLSTENVLVNTQIGGNIRPHHICIGNFGRASFLGNRCVHPYGQYGKYNYYSPEAMAQSTAPVVTPAVYIHQRRKSDIPALEQSTWLRQSDVWALGMIIYQVIFGEMPVNFDLRPKAHEHKTLQRISDCGWRVVLPPSHSLSDVHPALCFVLDSTLCAVTVRKQPMDILEQYMIRQQVPLKLQDVGEEGEFSDSHTNMVNPKLIGHSNTI